MIYCVFLHGASVTATEMVNTFEPFLDNQLKDMKGKTLTLRLIKK
ncbi:MAG: hypothetical protein Q8R96_00835 [Bacteroidota bacterium]|nr:hypothetical protein [Bacteroidota bacterium]